MTREYIDKELENDAYNSGIVDDLFDEVFDYFEGQKNCENCKYWNKVGKSKTHGKCSELVSYDFLGTTEKSFGCNKYKE